MSDTIDKLLKEVKDIIENDKENRFQKGEYFNVFKIQNNSTDELKICLLLRELLDPKGSHGQGSFFLRRFLDKIKYNSSNLEEADYYNATVKTEVSIDENRRIDLLIQINKCLIPFETKIYAKDQESQCYDYYKFVEEKNNKKHETVLYYLTLDGHEPSETSRMEKCSNGGSLTNGQYKTISFGEDITSWLSDCVDNEELKLPNSVREILIQFRKGLKELCNTDGDLEMEIKKKIRENAKAAWEIKEKLNDELVQIEKRIFKDIKDHLKKYDLVAERELPKSSHKIDSNWAALYYKIPNVNELYQDSIVLVISIDSDGLYYGVAQWDNEKKKLCAKNNNNTDITNFALVNLKPTKVEVSNSQKWYWYKYFNADINLTKEDCINLFDDKFFEDKKKKVYEEIDLYLKDKCYKT